MSVWFAKKNNILVYPVGLVNVTVYFFLCYQARLYADMSIQAYYFFMSLYGWRNWHRLEKKTIATVSFASRAERKRAVWLWWGSFVVIYLALRHTDTDVPAWDASTTSLAVVAMWLLTKKKIENWIFWILSDLIALPLYAYKGLLLTTLQYAFFVIFAVSGLMAWIRLRENKTQSA